MVQHSAKSKALANSQLALVNQPRPGSPSAIYNYSTTPIQGPSSTTGGSGGSHPSGSNWQSILSSGGAGTPGQSTLSALLGNIGSQVGAIGQLPGQQAASGNAAVQAANTFQKAQGAGAFPGQTFPTSFPSANAYGAVGSSFPTGASSFGTPSAPPTLPQPQSTIPITPPFPGNHGPNTLVKEINPQPGTASAAGGALSGVPSFKKGGVMKRDGLAYLHKGEHVVPVATAKAKSKALKSKMKHN